MTSLQIQKNRPVDNPKKYLFSAPIFFIYSIYTLTAGFFNLRGNNMKTRNFAAAVYI